MVVNILNSLKKRRRMTTLHRSDFIHRFLTSFLVILMLFGSFPLVMGEDPTTISQASLNVDLGAIHQLDVTIGEPVVMYQEMTVKNTGNKTINTTISLENYPDIIPEVYLEEYLSLTVTSDGTTHSINSVIPVVLAPYQSKDYILEYEFVPVYKDIECNETTIQDYLPEDAVILPSTLPPETVIEKKCNVKIHHDGDIHYYNVEVTLEELEGQKINSIYYVEGDQYLKLENGVISLAK